jgi:hypothetical protein
LVANSTRASSTRSADQPGLGDLVGRATRGAQVIVDEEVAVSAHGWQLRGFTLPSSRPIEVVAEGKTHTDKGFTLYVMASDQAESFKMREAFKHIASFEGLKVRSFGHTETLGAGYWTVVVQNSENVLNSAA